MNKKILIFIVCVLCLFIGINYFQKENSSFSEFDKIKPEMTKLQRENEYYVYFYSDDSDECKEIEESLKKFAESDTVYFCNVDEHETSIVKYDWQSHHEKFDKEIGYSEDGKNIIYFDGESEEKYTGNMENNEYGKLMKYEIIIADEEYKELNSNAKIGNVYASLLTPEIDYYDTLSGKKPTIAGTPTLLKVVKKKITEFYYGSHEIIELIDN